MKIFERVNMKDNIGLLYFDLIVYYMRIIGDGILLWVV